MNLIASNQLTLTNVNDGAQGKPGTDGKTQYTHIAYADDATGGGFSQTDQTKAYIGMYVDFTATDSTDVTKYKWSKWHGDKGATGAQGIQGPKGADGRTPYLHIAYANSSDGRTDFSTSNTDNKRYLGTYTDYTQADSTDPSKYKWVDMVGSVEFGGRNLLRGTKEMRLGSGSWSSGTFRKAGTGTVENVDVADSPIPSISRGIKITSGGTSGEIGIAQDSFNLQTGWVTLTYYVKGTVGQTVQLQPFLNTSNTSGRNSITLDGSWQKISFSANNTKVGTHSIGYIYLTNKAAGNSVTVIAGMEEYATNGSDWQPAFEDIEDNLNSKADQELVQQQLNALAEQNAIAKAEMEAKASIDTVLEWITAYQNYVKANDKAKAESERNLQEASARIIQLKTYVGTMKQQWDFIDTYMSVQNEGLIIGKSDGSAYAKFANDRISLFSGSSEVMYISQGTLHIENGIFTKTIQIGRFRFETHPADADMLVVRFVGG